MFVFFFQAEDGIRDLTVTGVQTCALPISSGSPGDSARVFASSRGRQAPLIVESTIRKTRKWFDICVFSAFLSIRPGIIVARSEERRVGKSVDLGGRRIIQKKNKIQTHQKK